MPASIDADAAGPREVHAMSSGNLSDIQKLSDASAFDTPLKARRRSAEEMSGSSGVSSQAG